MNPSETRDNIESYNNNFSSAGSDEFDSHYSKWDVRCNINGYQQNQKSKKWKGRFWDLKVGITAENMICVDQLGALGSVTKDLKQNTGRFILLDSDKCPKCASGKYEDIEVSFNLILLIFIQTLKNIFLSEVSKWPLAPTILLGFLPSNRVFTKYPN